MISESILSTLPKPPNNPQQAQAQEFRFYREFKDYEKQVYKDLHATVLTDDGMPTLKKSAFRMPGYRRVVSDSMDRKEEIEEIGEIKEEDSFDSSSSASVHEDVIYQNPVTLVDEHERVKRHAEDIVEMMKDEKTEPSRLLKTL